MPNNVTKAMNWLADTPEGGAVLSAIAEAGEAVRAKLPVKLSNGELKYVMEHLWAQRGTEGWSADAHFDVQPSSESTAGLSKIHAPTQIAGALKVRNKGFVILASIPQARF